MPALLTIYARLAISGLRHANPEGALKLLPEVIERTEAEPQLPLGEILWAYYGDARIGSGRFSEALQDLSSTARQQCREAFQAVGATQDMITNLLGDKP